MTTTRFTLLAAFALAGALTACTTNTATEPTSTTASVSASNETPTAGATIDTITPTSGTSTDPSSSTSEVPASSEAPATTEAPPTTETSSTTAPSPVDGFGLAGQDLADAQAAWDTYQAYRAFSAQATANPGGDWTAQIASLMGYPADEAFQKSLTNFAKLQITLDNQTFAEITKIEVKPDFVTFSACIDATGTKSFDKDGKDVTAPDAPGSYKRHPGEIWMERQSGVWRFVDSKNDYQTKC